jgi:hypothetical protein
MIRIKVWEIQIEIPADLMVVYLFIIGLFTFLSITVVYGGLK